MALTGDLSTFSFVDIFQILAKDRRSGILLVEWQDMTVAYYVKEGEVVFARPVDRVFRVYAERDFDNLIDKLRISKESLPKTVERFLISKLGSKEGVFSFTPGFIRYNSDMPFYYPIEKLIMIAARTLTPEEVERKISDEMLTFERAHDYVEKIRKAELTREEERILMLVDGERSVADIRRESGLDNLTVDRTLYGLLALGVLRRKKREKRHKPSITLELLAKIIERIKEL
ncbi:MAG: DUF4388 domain-containing protein [Hydrogenobacter thermophilus]|uniref:PatA-like N-terminal domain-containing protein n=1 Tax=Hydrogenobacter thermophilus (strain DSM 6534 / IAM 12695 / TK-6) TaxID=608538 RepID=D3DGT3_HYDTT|nr:DUF4388 domain-containing protein [Hydrogenobacter thermophilus]ADO44971.1 conserved hypothetical protein [Hydrogenobacter thermophilus TK-6]MCS7284345.1 DUF4388 domain-containing protein [Hydrogenobacter thermophilus]BAI69035.1 hypothetical protein HTH_0573 [Hydrogenobacter thermophilus TK-6]GBC88579.1 hypothetical protein HRbin13_00703 [bacterium HR13]